jgi:hypothetical protein
VLALKNSRSNYLQKIKRNTMVQNNNKSQHSAKLLVMRRLLAVPMFALVLLLICVLYVPAIFYWVVTGNDPTDDAIDLFVRVEKFANGA